MDQKVNRDGTGKAGSLTAQMAEIGRRARAAARVLAEAPRAQKDEALKAMAAALRVSRVPPRQ